MNVDKLSRKEKKKESFKVKSIPAFVPNSVFKLSEEKQIKKINTIAKR